MDQATSIRTPSGSEAAPWLTHYLLGKATRILPLIAFALFLISCSGPSKADLRDYGRAPEFSLTESGGRTVTLKDLQGKVWIADFIFTSCAGTCPMMSGQMRKLQDSLPREIHLISFSVDPTRDTPAVLANYSKTLGADPQRWMFLTGDHQALYNLSIKGFKLALDDTQGSEAEPITHSSRFALIDRNGQIRGCYSGTEGEDLKRLSDNARKLL